MSNPDSDNIEPLEPEPLEALAERIVSYAKEADEKTLEAAMLIREARKRVDAGEAGDVTWETWAREKLKLGDSRLRELQRIAKAKDPQKELERQREMTRERVERHREKKKSAAFRNAGASLTETAELEAVRQSLIDWAREAPIDRVTEVLFYARKGDSEDTNSNSDEPAETAAA
jgi:hypothetical protein